MAPRPFAGQTTRCVPTAPAPQNTPSPTPLPRHALLAILALFASAALAPAVARAQNCGDPEWVQRFTPFYTPAPRSGHAMCYDSTRHRVILFGGRLADGTLSNGTWIYDGVCWTLLDILSPSPREEHAMVYDPVRDRVYLFGGENAQGLTNHTYEFNPDTLTWTQLLPALNPSPRRGHAMVYDSTHHTVVLFGGELQDGSLSAGHWTFNPTTGAWTQFPGATPAARTQHAMAFDSLRARVVLFGGRTNPPGASPGQFSNSIWEFDGTSWTQPPVSSAIPFGRAGHTMVFDGQGKTFIFGGRGDTNADGVYEYSNATWLFDGEAFNQLLPLIAPTPRAEAAITLDSAHDRLVLFGGMVASGARSGATLEYGDIAPPTITVDPAPLALEEGRTAVFTVFSDAHRATYLWHKDAEPLEDFGLVTGVHTPQLVVNNISAADAGLYWCKVTNPCLSVGSASAALSVIPTPELPCPLDVNQDGVVNAADVDAVLAAFDTFLGLPGYNPRTDLNADGAVDQNDADVIQTFLNENGPTPCPGATSCPADFDLDGHTTVSDLFAYLDDWFAQFPSAGSGLSADYDDNGAVDVADLFTFLDDWFSGFGQGC